MRLYTRALSGANIEVLSHRGIGAQADRLG